MMLATSILIEAYKIMATAKAMAEIYDENRSTCKYVHSTSRGHEAIQIATGLHLQQQDWFSPYYRDDSMMLSAGFTPYEMMLQLLAKKDDPFSGGRSYYCHPSNKDGIRPSIIHQSSATGMQGIPTTGLAQGIQFIEQYLPNFLAVNQQNKKPVVLCSFGDNSITEGEVSEAFQFAVLKQLPIIYLVQDNDWGISVTGSEARAMNAFEYAAGFKGMERLQCDGSDFIASYETMQAAFNFVRTERKPILVHAKVPLLGHHTSGVRKEFYRTKEDLQEQSISDPIIKLRRILLENNISEVEINVIDENAKDIVNTAFSKAQDAEDPPPSDVEKYIFAPTSVKEETGERNPINGEKILMVDAALYAIKEIMEQYPEAILYGQDVGRRLGGVFREAATLAEKFGDHRVFNTAIQEAYIIGSTIGMSAVGLKPIVEVQFADYIYPGLNQLVTEISKSCYLSNGKFPVQMILRVPIGAYGGGGPYHSGSIESTLLTIKGIKICYPSNAADMKGLMKAAFLDPNPVVMLEHKGLYWSKVPGTDDAKTVEPSSDYILPLGKGNIVLEATQEHIENGTSLVVITYGMGVYWAKAAAENFNRQVEIIDLRTLYPLDEYLIFASSKKHGRVLIVTEEQQNNSFTEALSHRIYHQCFQFLDAPIEVFGSLNLPAVPINLSSESAMLPNVEKIKNRIKQLLQY